MSSDADDSASHNALLNHCLNTCSADGSARSLPSCLGSSISKGSLVEKVSISDLRARFNDGDLVECALIQGYQCCLRDLYVTQLPGDHSPVESVPIGWMNEQGHLQFYAH